MVQTIPDCLGHPNGVIALKALSSAEADRQRLPHRTDTPICSLSRQTADANQKYEGKVTDRSSPCLHLAIPERVLLG